MVNEDGRRRNMVVIGDTFLVKGWRQSEFSYITVKRKFPGIVLYLVPPEGWGALDFEECACWSERSGIWQ